jgi:hypothetical protein
MSRATRVCPPNATTALFVEGGDDERMVQRLLPDLPLFIQVFDGRAPKQLADRARAARNDPGWYGIRRVGVILDAEEDPAASWALAMTVFTAIDWPQPSTEATVHVDGDRWSGAALVPGPGQPGGSETLLLATAQEAERRCIDAFFTCTPNPGTTVAQRDKARVQVLAASRTAKGRPDQLWSTVDPAHPALHPLRAFLNRLAGD